ncbi:hypothetical protein D6779_04460 [Candidatus Parcubacteria bacterium]|nr:MAG: hypothetical protein D6779_04460 [Candidatus Parcubacteria bacterium]
MKLPSTIYEAGSRSMNSFPVELEHLPESEFERGDHGTFVKHQGRHLIVARKRLRTSGHYWSVVVTDSEGEILPKEEAAKLIGVDVEFPPEHFAQPQMTPQPLPVCGNKMIAC